MKNPRDMTLRNISASFAPLRFNLSSAVAALALLAMTAGLRPALSPARIWQADHIGEAAREQANESAFAVILGELRASAADLMWVKTERYLHNGVAFAPHVDADALARTGEVAHTHGHGHSDHDHDHEAPLIPPPERDWRGFIGTLHRRVHPWQDVNEPHAHAPGDQLLPWYRLLTLSNPRHWRGYMIGAWWLSRPGEEGGSLAEAEAFIDEGIRNNPEVFQLHLMRGRILLAADRPAEAVESFDRAAELGWAARPAGESPRWGDSEEEDFAAALRYSVLVPWRRLDDPDAARRALARALQRLPDDTPLRNLERELEFHRAH